MGPYDQYCPCEASEQKLGQELGQKPKSELKGGGGGGGGVHPDFFVKLGFDIAVDQQTRTSDRTFEGVPDPNRQTVPAGQPRPYLVQIRPNLAKYPEHALNPYFRCSTCS